jgi:hypothetical protein
MLSGTLGCPRGDKVEDKADVAPTPLSASLSSAQETFTRVRAEGKPLTYLPQHQNRLFAPPCTASPKHCAALHMAEGSLLTPPC